MYRYEICGTGNGGQSWKTQGTLEGRFPDLTGKAMRESFIQLTQGKAIYGKPGVRCHGPYHITKFLIEEAL